MTTRDDDGQAVYKLGSPAQRYRAGELVCVITGGRCEVHAKESGRVVDAVTRPLAGVEVRVEGRISDSMKRRLGLA